MKVYTVHDIHDDVYMMIYAVRRGRSELRAANGGGSERRVEVDQSGAGAG